MAVYDFFLSRNNGPTVSTYVGHSGRLFYDPAERVLRISDGSTIGGEIFNGVVTVSNTEPTLNFQGQIWLNPENYALTVYHNGNFIPTIDVATETTIGGVKLGPGVTTNGDGQIIIDSTGLDFSFGDFSATVGTYTSNTEYAILSAINADEDVVIASNGTGGINVVGQFHVHPTNGSLTEILEEEPVFAVKADGQVKILVPTIDSAAGAVSIVGSSLGQFISPVNTGVMLHVTGNLASPGIPSRIYNDAQNAFAAFVARRFNGTVSSPTAVLANEEIMRISGTAHNGTSIPGTGNQRIVYKALGNQTLSNQGGDMEFWATPLNSTTIGKVATVGSTGITLETGKVLTGDVTGNVSGTAGSVAAANVTGTTLASNVVTSSLTTVGTLGSLTVTDSSSAKHHTTTPVEIGSTGANFNLDLSAGELQHVTVTGDVTITPQNPVAGRTTKLIITFSGNRTVTHGIAAAMTTTKSATIASNNQIRVLEYYQLGSTLATDVYLNVN